MTDAAHSPHATVPRATATTSPSRRPLIGLAGIFLAAMTAGLNNRVGAVALADVRGALGFGVDDASWLATAYSAGELIAMPFSAWLAMSLSVRRFQLWTLGLCLVSAAMLPLLHRLDLLLALRFVQGLAGGAMIPVLMMAALKFLPPPVRLHGLALYAMTATFAPNLSVWVAGHWTDGVSDWRWVYWQVVPLAGLAGAMVAWGLPREPIQAARFGQANWFGMACGVPALALIAMALDQGVRLDWFNSPLVALSLAAGLPLLGVFLLTEWHHPTPFIKLQILGRRNLGLGFTVFLVLLVTLTSGSMLPALQLASLHAYRPAQLAPLALAIALPQLVFGPAVAALLYRKWVDARIVLAGGLALTALACFAGAQVSSDWHREQFLATQVLHALGQPMAVVSLLFLATSVVQPHEGPHVSGTINTIRAFGSLAGAAVVLHVVNLRQRFHAEMLLDRAAQVGEALAHGLEPMQWMRVVGHQAMVLSVADAYRLLGLLALLTVPLALCLTRVAPPAVQAAPPAPPVPPSPHG